MKSTGVVQIATDATQVTTNAVVLLMWRSYLVQRRRSLRTELAEIESILHQMTAEQSNTDGVEKQS